MIQIFRAMDSRKGYAKSDNKLWSPESRVRNTERKFQRSRNCELLPGIDLDDPMLPTFVRSATKGRDGIDIDDPWKTYKQLSAVPPSIIPIVRRVLLILVLILIAEFQL